jgi:VCBS repeat-containing protein
LSNVVSRTVLVSRAGTLTVVAHSYTAVGNTPLGVGTNPPRPAATVAGTVLDGDSDPGAALSVTANTTPAHGTVTVNPDGAFTYQPDPGYTGTDAFEVTITGSDGRTATATITINVGTVVWYVNGSLAPAGNGTAGSPFRNLAAAVAAAGPDSIIFLYQGVYGAAYMDTFGAATMQPGEDLWGQPHGLTVDGYTLVTPGGYADVIGWINLADGADVEGVSFSSPAGERDSGPLIRADGVNNATVGAASPVAIQGGIMITGGDGNLCFGNDATDESGGVLVTGRTGGTVTFAGPVGGSVYLAGNTGATIAFTGTLGLSEFTATGGGTVTATGSGSTITAGEDENALTVENTTIGKAGLTFQSVSSDDDPYGIDLGNTGSYGRVTVTGTGTPGSGGTIRNSAGAGIQLASTYDPGFAGMMILGNAGAGISAAQVTGLTLAGSSVSGNGTGGTGGGLQISTGISGAFRITGSSFTANSGAGVDVTATGNATVCAAITGNTVTGSAGQGAADIELAQDATSTISLPGYTGAPDDTGAVESFLQGGNDGDGTPTAIATVSGSGGGFVGATNC